MMRKMKLALMSVVMILMAGVGVAMPAMADDISVCNDPKMSDELREAAGCKTDKVADTMINSLIKFVLTLTGIIAVGAMVYGGFVFLMSAGDAAKVKKGQDVLKYGLIGLAVCLLAYALVLFVSAGVSS